jgi:TolB-like protein/AraC-like DNA-binding protein
MTEPVSMDQVLIKKLTDIILSNIRNEHFGVKDLASEAGISRITLYRKIKSIKNQDTSQFIREIRLRRAMELLQQNAGTVSEIAFMVGFGDPYYFNKCFHEFFGVPPGKIKKEAVLKAVEIIPAVKRKTNGQKRPVWRTLVISLSGILLLAVLFIGYTIIFNNSHSGEANTTMSLKKSIAVLPFKNLTDTLGSQYFVDAVMEDVRDNLGKIHDLSVISRTSTEQFRENTPSTSEIAQKLKVNYLVEGSCQKIGNSFNLSVHLIDAARDWQIWSHSYQQEIRETRDIFKIQSQVAQAIASELEANITPEEKVLIEKIPTTSLTAHDFYQRGRDNQINYWTNGNNADLDRAEDLYHKALIFDSTYAPAYTGLAKVYWDKHFFLDYMSENFMDSVLILCNKALAFDNQLADAYTMMGKYYGQKGDIANAISHIDKALKLNPNDWSAYRLKGETDIDPINNIRYLQKAMSLNRGPELPGLLQEIGWVYACYGFPERAMQCYQDKLKLDGNLPEYYSSAARDEFWLENFNKSLELEKKGYAIDSTNTLILEFIALDYQWLGQFGESLKYFKKWFERLNSTGVLANSYYYKDNYLFNMMHRIGYVYRVNGYKDEAEYYFNEEIKYCNKTIENRREYGRTYSAFYDLAGIYAFRGNKKKALENLRAYNQVMQTYQWMVMLFKTDPLLQNIRDDPEFRQIVRDIETKYQAEHESVKKWLEEQGQL